jgi:hypothetical protein
VNYRKLAGVTSLGVASGLISLIRGIARYSRKDEADEK